MKFRLLVFLLVTISSCSSSTKVESRKTLKQHIIEQYYNEVVLKYENRPEYLDINKYDIRDALMKCDDIYLLRFTYDNNRSIDIKNNRSIDIKRFSSYQMGDYVWFDYDGEFKTLCTYAWKNEELCTVYEAYQKGWLNENYIRWHEEYTILTMGYPNKLFPYYPIVDSKLSNNIINFYTSLVVDELNSIFID